MDLLTQTALMKYKWVLSDAAFSTVNWHFDLLISLPLQKIPSVSSPAVGVHPIGIQWRCFLTILDKLPFYTSFHLILRIPEFCKRYCRLYSLCSKNTLVAQTSLISTPAALIPRKFLHLPLSSDLLSQERTVLHPDPAFTN